MKKVMKKGMLWCLILMLVLTFQSLSASAATKKANLKAPTVSNWKKTWDGSWNTPKSDGVEYTITWKKVAGASGYQVKYSLKESGVWTKYYFTQTSHIKNKLSTLKNQCFNPQNNNQAALCPYSNASCMYFGSL